jgi:AcrR family transcriptional regulator
MARIVKETEYAVKRNGILDVAQRLVYTKGYEQMAIQDILDQLQISKGAFYHYFDSKPALLEALIERMQQEAEQQLFPIMEDPHLRTFEKLQRFFAAAARWKTERKAYLLALLQVWYADENAIVRQKVQVTLVKHVAPLLTGIIRQGIEEGVLITPFPDQVGSIIIALFLSFGDAFVELMFSDAPECDKLGRAERLAAAYTDSLERLLGAPTGSLELIDAETVKAWMVPERSDR